LAALAYHSGSRSALATTPQTRAAGAGMVRSLAISIIAFPSTKLFLREIGILYGMPNQSDAEQFDQLYGRLWRALFKADAEDLSQHELQLLHHVPAANGISLGAVARHLGIPKS